MIAGSQQWTPMQPGAGPQTLDRYVLGERIGRGGMAEVYRGRLTRVGGFVREVAIKLLLPQLATETEFIHMLMDEARIAGTITHPNVVQVLDVGQEGETFYLVMEFVEGTDLRSVERRHPGGAVPLDPLLFVVAEVLRGLEAIHGAHGPDGAPLRIIHRDVTPSNVLLGRGGAVKLGDFGIAHASGRLTQTQHGAVKGKTRYMAPEQLVGGTIDHRSDLFAVGVVFLEALLGRDSADAWQATGMGPIFRLPVRVPPTIPREVGDILRRALTEDPIDRYPTAAQFRREVLRVLHQRSIERGADAAYGTDELAGFLGEVLQRPDPRAGKGADVGEAHGAREEEPAPEVSVSAPVPPPAFPSEPATLVPAVPFTATTRLLPTVHVDSAQQRGAPFIEDGVRDLSQESTAISRGPLPGVESALREAVQSGALPAYLDPGAAPQLLISAPENTRTEPNQGPLLTSMARSEAERGASVDRAPWEAKTLTGHPPVAPGDMLGRPTVDLDAATGQARSVGNPLAQIPEELLNDPMAAPLLAEGSTGVALRRRRDPMLTTLARVSRRNPLAGVGLILLAGLLLVGLVGLLVRAVLSSGGAR